MRGGGEGSNRPIDKRTDAERIQQARNLYHQERLRADRLEQEIEALRKEKKPGRDPLRCVGPRTDRFSLPRPDNYQGPPEKGPSGTYPHDRLPPVNEVKPILMEKPEPFEGAHNDIERFLGDCLTYFEVFRQQFMQHPTYMVVFATSLFKGEAKNWWVHLRDKYAYDPEEEEDDDEEDEESPPFNGGPRYRFPTWKKFTEMVRDQFHDPAIELVHKRKMSELRMIGPTYQYFR